MDDPSSGLDDLIKVHRAIFNLETIQDKELRLVFNLTFLLIGDYNVMIMLRFQP